MAKEDQDSTDEMVFDFNSNEFTRRDLVTALHDMKPARERTGLRYSINECSTSGASTQPLLEKDSLKPIKFFRSSMVYENDKTEDQGTQNATKKKKLEESIWFLDSGCSRHMTGNKDLLTEIVNYRGPTITFGDNSKGYTVVFQKLICTVKTTAGNIMLTGHREKNTYKVKWNYDYLNAPTCFIALNGNKNWLWHKRLNYLNFKSISTISRLKLVSGLPNIDFAKDRICNACQLGKQVRSTFKSRRRNSSARCLELLDMDLFGPIPIYMGNISKLQRSNRRSSNQAAQKTSNEKSEATDRIRSDRGTEFLNQYLSSYLEDHGIKHELSAARSPQQNGVAERRNRTLKEAARTMLAESSISQRFCAEAINTASVSKEYRVYNQRTLTVEESIHIVFDESSICHENISNSIHDLINKFDATNLEARSNDEVDLRKTGENISKENPTAQEQTQQANEPEDNQQTQNTQIEEELEHEEEIIQPTELNPYGPCLQWKKDHPLELVIGNPTTPLRNRNQMINEFMHAAFVSQIEPKKIDYALLDTNWIEAMQEELNQFERSKVWHLVPRPNNTHVIGTRWVFRNKMDENGLIIINKARLVAQGYR
ncbi:uncharacterized protein LOC142523824 [Primulina tabacum]|uniref:uncharacterized protein LOC142523824 n=1 Tax=Primulina tabacum TaxID=48773 RepID=UPI003F5A8399